MRSNTNPNNRLRSISVFLHHLYLDKYMQKLIVINIVSNMILMNHQLIKMDDITTFL